MAIKLPSAKRIEQHSWMVRAVLGAAAGSLALALTYVIPPLRLFPLLLAFPTVVLCAWYLGMWGGFSSAIVATLLADWLLASERLRFALFSVGRDVRLPLFLVVSTFVGWAIRRSAQKRAEIGQDDLRQRLLLADAQRELAEERARASEMLRERDKALQLALRANGMGLWIWDLEKEITDWSDGLYRIIGREPGSVEPSFSNWLAAVHPEDADRVRSTVSGAGSTGTEYSQQYRVIWPDESVHWVESRAQVLLDRDGKVIRLLGVVADITAQKRAEDAMLRAEKLAIAGRLAASVAHEINNPLEAIANLLYLISFAETAEDAKRFAEQALDQLLRVSLITQSTLKFHRQLGAPKTIHLSEVLEPVLSLFRGRMLDSGTTIDLRSEGELPVACMPSEMQQIFANLVANSLDAMPNGGSMIVRLRPSADWRNPAIRGMRVTFLDSGTGMDRLTIQRMFEPFFTTKQDTGTGLGMWVVAQLIERHEGHICAWSWQRPNTTGTAISLFLPTEKPAGTATSDPGQGMDAQARSALVH